MDNSKFYGIIYNGGQLKGVSQP